MSTDHYATIKLSKDGGHNWGAATIHDLGATGTFCEPAIRRRLGLCRQLVMECSVSSPFKATVLAMSAHIDKE